MRRSKHTWFRPFIAMLLFTAIAVGQGTKITPPKNSYKPADDVKLGREAATEVARELPLLPENGDADNYIERVGRSLGLGDSSGISTLRVSL